MNVLSLFDGMSCGQVALQRAGISYQKYFASEIDKYAIQVTQKNFPNTVQLGDVTKLDVTQLPEIDILFAGFPCQSHSSAGKHGGFDDPRGQLFFDLLRVLEEVKPRYFLCENVRMKKESQDVISQRLGVEPIMINSALVSGQNRVRLYWTNIPNVTQPHDRGILLQDVLEDGVVDRDKSYAIDARYGFPEPYRYYTKHRDQIVYQGAAFRSRGKKITQSIEYIEVRKDSKSNAILGTRGQSWVCATEAREPIAYRKLTPIECERLQTLPDNYTDVVSNSQRYKMIGNGWTVDVISHILQGIKS